MSNWEMVKLGDVFKISSGGTPSKSKPEYYENGTIQWVRTGDLKNKYITRVDSLITEKALSNSSAKLFPIDTVLIAMYGATIGACSILAIEAATNQACAAFLPNKEVDSSYLYFFLCSKKDDFIKLGVGGAQPNISATILKGVNIPIPPLETQKQIAKTLDSAAELLAMRKRQLAELDNFIKSTFYDMFGDPVANKNGWLILPLGESLKVKHGFAFQGEYFSNKGEYVLLTPGNFYEEGGYRDRGDKQKYYQGDIPQEYLLNIGDLLIAMTEQAPGLLGSPLVVPESNKFLHNQRLGLIVLKKANFNKLYLFHMFNHHKIRKLVHLMATGTKVRHTSPSKIEEIEVTVPPIELQNQFANIVTKIEEQKALVKKAIDETQYLFDSLMSEYFE